MDHSDLVPRTAEIQLVEVSLCTGLLRVRVKVVLVLYNIEYFFIDSPPIVPAIAY